MSDRTQNLCSWPICVDVVAESNVLVGSRDMGNRWN